MLRIAIIGDKDTVLPFKGLGIEAVLIDEPEEGREKLKQIANEEYGIVFVSESVAQGCLDIIENISEKKSLPIITIVSDFRGEALEVSEKRLRKLIRRAVGMEIY